MFRYFMGTKSSTNAAYDAFIEYVNSYQEFLSTAERRALKVSPAHRKAWQNAFSLQRLLKQRQSQRFKYLFARGELDMATFKSLDSIADRLDTGWTEVELTLERTCRNMMITLG